MDILPIRKLYISPCDIKLSGENMVKPKGTTGATKMKIMAIIDHNCGNGADSYGYTIWQSLKAHFYIYLTDGDVRNVYHHLKELTELGYLIRAENLLEDPTKRQEPRKSVLSLPQYCPQEHRAGQKILILGLLK